MKVKELIDLVNKDTEVVREALLAEGFEFKAATKNIPDGLVEKIKEKFKPKPMKRVVRVIKKGDKLKKEQEDSQKTEEVDNKIKEQVDPADKSTTEESQGVAPRKEDAPAKSKEKDVVVSTPPAEAKPDASKKSKTRVFEKKRGNPSFEKGQGRFTDNFSQKLFSNRKRKKKSKYKKMNEKLQQETMEVKEKVESIKITKDSYILSDFASMVNVAAVEIIKELMKSNMLVTINQEVDIKVISKICEAFGIEMEMDNKKDDSGDAKIKMDLELMELNEKEDLEEDMVTRPPVITIMGHVDHGKTKLLDTIRDSRVIEGEAGGITQHIGAYQIEYNKKKLTFLDTPGHEAFTALRARGAQVTDIVILIIAADDGIMPQTKEALDHAKAAGVPIIVAINKIDKPNSDPMKVKKQLADSGLNPEEWGGETIVCEISAKENIGIKELLDMVLLVSEMEDVKAVEDKNGQGVVIEASLSKQKGPIATVLVKSGTLKKGDIYVVGATYGKVRAMFDDRGNEVLSAPPATPVELIGINTVPQSGDTFYVVEDEKTARDIASKREEQYKAKMESQKKQFSLQRVAMGAQEGTLKELKLIVKADVQGSMEAIIGSLQKIKNNKVLVDIIHYGTGIISESDIMLAKASEAIVIGFHIEMNNEAERVADDEGVEVRLYDIIYKMLEDIEMAVEGLMDPEYEDIEIGTIEIRSIFQSSKVGIIAGSFVIEGSVKNNTKVHIFRGGEFINESRISSLKRFNENVKEVQTNYECGIVVDKIKDLQEGDTMKVFEKREIKR